MSRPPSRAIFLTSESPYPPTGGAKLRDSQLLTLLAERLEAVEVLCFGDPRDGASESGSERIRVTTVPRRPGALWRRAISPLRPRVVKRFSADIVEELRKNSVPGRLLWVSRLEMARYIPIARSMGYRVVLDEHYVESGLLMDAALSSPARWPSSLVAAQCAYYEESYCESAHAVVATSDIDASRLHKLARDARVHVIPNTVDCARYQAARESRGTTLFFGGTLSYPASVEGLSWFCSEVLPRLRAALKDEMPKVVVAGAKPSRALVDRLRSSGIEVHPNPVSMIPLLAQAAVVFIPIRSGGGTTLKILEAMASGRPVVSTGKAAEGLALTPTYDAFIADQEDAFTSAIIRLLRDPALRSEVGGHAARTVQARYDSRCIRPMLDGVLEAVLSGGAAP